MGVTDHVIAATHRAISTISVIPAWIGSIGNRLGGLAASSAPLARSEE